jgi:hypothetical protein
MKLLLILALVLTGVIANAQSPFRAEPKVISNTNRFAHAVVAQTDSFVNVWRFTGNVAVYNYNLGSSGGSSALTGAEYGYEHQKWDYAAGTWNVLWSVNAAWFPINTALPITLANMQTFGVTFGFKNPLPIGNSIIQIGPDFNPHAPKPQQFGVLATVGILFN